MQSTNENGTDYHKPTEEFMPTWGYDDSWLQTTTPNGFRKKSKKHGCNFTKSKKKRKKIANR